MRLVRVDRVQPGMLLGEALVDGYGRLLLAEKAPLTAEHLAHLQARGIAALYLYEPDTSDIRVEDPIRPEVRAKALENLNTCFSSLTRSGDEPRPDSARAALENLRNGRLPESMRSLSQLEGLHALFRDVDNMIQDLTNKDVLVGLNSIKSHDTYTFQHSVDVTVMALLLARKLAWDAPRVRAFAIGCILHDIGKIFVHPGVLNKPSRLTKEEFAEIKAHPALGHKLIQTIAPGLGYLAPHVAYQHHERQDGGGYPRGLKGNNRLGGNLPKMIHDFGAVAAVADVYDALCSDRPYRWGCPVDKVCQLIRDASGTHLNRSAVRIFEEVVASYPVATEVAILTGKYAGHRGVVSHVYAARLDRPRVRVLFDSSGQRIEPVEIDLRQEPEISIESIGRTRTSWRDAA